jgi:hypothetical protein
MVEPNENENITIQKEKGVTTEEPLIVSHVVTSLQDYCIMVVTWGWPEMIATN